MNALAPAIAEANERISLEEAIRLGAEDPIFYSRFFFPKACRQNPPPFHLQMWDDLLSQQRWISFMVFRGGAKTTLARLYLSFVIAYGISRTILVVGKSQDAAARTVEWLQRAVEFNTKWAGAFNLRKGDKWSGIEADIWHGTDEVPIRVVAVGITGSVRGINVDDYRPDLIFVDDPCDEENTATPEARKKTATLFFGALAKSLAPASEAPLAKMVLAQTVLNKDDLISLTVKDRQWKSSVFSCFNANGESAWPERWTTEELLEDKQGHIDRGQLSVWLKEMECRVINDETAAFPSNFLQYWDVLPEGGRTILAVDPTPPPRNLADIAKSASNLDDAAIVVLRQYKDSVYVCDAYGTKSPDPDELIAKIFELCQTWGAREVVVETVLFARVLATLLEKEMLRKRKWLTVSKIEDPRNKVIRIRQEIAPLYTTRKIFFHPTLGSLLEQLSEYPSVNHDDYLDALAIGLQGLSAWILNAGDDDFIEGDYEDVTEEAVDDGWKGCP